jgi:hypothetical protein
MLEGQNMVDLMGSEKAGKWSRMDKLLLGMSVMMFGMTGFFTVFILLIASVTGTSICIITMNDTLFLVSAVVLWIMYKQRKGMWLKIFSYDNDTVISALKQMCYQNKINFNLTGPGASQLSPIKYVETFELPDYGIMIRVQKHTQLVTVLGVGIETPDTTSNIEKIKDLLDESFKPNILG